MSSEVRAWMGSSSSSSVGNVILLLLLLPKSRSLQGACDGDGDGDGGCGWQVVCVCLCSWMPVVCVRRIQNVIIHVFLDCFFALKKAWENSSNGARYIFFPLSEVLLLGEQRATASTGGRMASQRARKKENAKTMSETSQQRKILFFLISFFLSLFSLSLSLSLSQEKD